MQMSDVKNLTPEIVEEQLAKVRELMEESWSRLDEVVAPGVDRVQSFVDAGKARLDDTFEPVVDATSDRVVKGVEAYDDQVKELRNRSLEGLDTLGARYVEFVKTVAERAPRVEMPLIGKLPSVEHRIAEGFDFAGEVLAKQKQITVAAVGAILPVVSPEATPAESTPKAKTTAKAKTSTTKARARKAPARKKAAPRKKAAASKS